MHNCNAQFYCLDGDPGSVQTSKILFFAKVKIWKPPSIAYYLQLRFYWDPDNPGQKENIN